MPSKLEDASKRNHGMDFRLSAQNVGSTIKCTECKKPRLMSLKKKLSGSARPNGLCAGKPVL